VDPAPDPAGLDLFGVEGSRAEVEGRSLRLDEEEEGVEAPSFGALESGRVDVEATGGVSGWF